MSTLRTRRRRDEGGFTLIELLVVMTLVGIVMAMVYGLVNTSLRTSQRAQSSSVDTQTAAVAIDRLTRDLRMAISPTAALQAFQSGSTGWDARFYTLVGSEPAPVLVRWWVDAAGVLRRAETRPVGSTPPYTWPGTPQSTTIVARGVVVDTRPLFRYYAPSDAIVAVACPDATPAPTPCATPMVATPVSTADLALVSAVDVRLPIRTGRDAQAGTAIQQTRVVMVNRGLVALPRNR